MGTIIKLDSVQDYNELLGVETLHPLVSVVDTICRGAKIADLIAIGGTLDYVVPDIDR